MIEVRIPTKAEDLRIRHFESMSAAPTGLTVRKEEGLHFLASFTGLHYRQLLDFRVEDVSKMIATALATLSKMNLTDKLPERIKIAGKPYCLVDPNKVGIGWHIDFSKCNINKDPVRLACLFYLQEGFNYSDVDENDNIKHPIDSRYEVFRDHFPLDLFIRCCGFFLTRSLNSTRRSMVTAKNLSLKDQISLMLKANNPFRGKQLLKQ